MIILVVQVNGDELPESNLPPKDEDKENPNGKELESEDEGSIVFAVPEALKPVKEKQYWQMRSKDGREPDYTPQSLAAKAIEYFEWVDTNPLYMAELMKSGDFAGQIANVPKRRPYTLTGFQLFANISHQTFLNYEKRPEKEYFAVCAQIRQTVYNQKFEGAAAGFFNHAIIARDLGLIDRADVKSGDKPLSGIPLLSFVDTQKPSQDTPKGEEDESDRQS